MLNFQATVIIIEWRLVTLWTSEKRLSDLYRAQSTELNIDGETCILYGISDENGFYSDFTTDKQSAEKFAEFLNQNGVEPCHVQDIIEDFFYSGAEKNDILFSEMK